MTNTARSTLFRLESELRQDEHEQILGRWLAEAYKGLTGLELEGNRPGPQPPDRLFSCRGLTIGVEMFELEQFYASRAMEERLTNKIYSEIERRGVAEVYLGMTVQIVFSWSTTTPATALSEWRNRGILNDPEGVVAKEVADLIMTGIPSAASLPDTMPGRTIRVDAAIYPALSVLSKIVTANKSPSQDIRRSDGKAAPLVIVGGVTAYTDTEIEASIERKMLEKMGDRSRWPGVDHAILVAHDLPRGRIYEGFGKDWSRWLERVAVKTRAIEAFNELWLITGQGSLTAEAFRICGNDPSVSDL